MTTVTEQLEKCFWKAIEGLKNGTYRVKYLGQNGDSYHWKTVNTHGDEYVYVVEYDPNIRRWRCECADFEHRAHEIGVCKHILITRIMYDLRNDVKYAPLEDLLDDQNILTTLWDTALEMVENQAKTGSSSEEENERPFTEMDSVELVEAVYGPLTPETRAILSNDLDDSKNGSQVGDNGDKTAEEETEERTMKALTKDVLEALKQPFPERWVQWKVQTTNRDKTRGLVVAYVDARMLMARLDEVVGPAGWSDEYTVLAQPGEHGEEWVVSCKLTIGGITKQDVGSGLGIKAAFTDAFKRVCVKFGLGRYLYFLPSVWVDLDERGNFEPPALPAWARPDRRNAA